MPSGGLGVWRLIAHGASTLAHNRQVPQLFSYRGISLNGPCSLLWRDCSPEARTRAGSPTCKTLLPAPLQPGLIPARVTMLTIKIL